MSKKMKLIMENFSRFTSEQQEKELFEEGAGAFAALMALAGGVSEPVFIDGQNYKKEHIELAIKQIPKAYKEGLMTPAQATSAIKGMTSALNGKGVSTQLQGYDVNDAMESLLIGSKANYDSNLSGGGSVLDIDGDGASGGTGQNIDNLVSLMSNQRGVDKEKTAKKIQNHPAFNNLPQQDKDVVYGVLANASN